MTDSLKRFVLLAKGAKGAAAKMVVQQALEAPDVHVFGELIEVPSVKEVEFIFANLYLKSLPS
eukprot:m.29038 g.29038  ORF g.29038 m.29038 type:complete len:63 (+) comp8056_c0_seq3:151-339(+)